MFHLTARVAWHDSRWNGSVCRQPSCNAFCVALDRSPDVLFFKADTMDHKEAC